MGNSKFLVLIKVATMKVIATPSLTPSQIGSFESAMTIIGGHRDTKATLQNPPANGIKADRDL